MFCHKMQTCALLLGLVMLATAREGRPLPPDETWPSECDCEELRLQIKTFLRLQEENITKELLEAMQLQEQQAERRAQEALRRQEGTAAALTEALLLREQRSSTALTRAVRLQVEEALRLFEQRATAALTEAVRLQVEETLLGERVSEKALNQLVSLSTPAVIPATPPSLTSFSSSASTFPSTSSSPSTSLTTSRSPSASASERPPAASAPPPATAPSALGAPTAGPRCDRHDQQTESKRVQGRVQEVKVRMARARTQPSPLEEALYKAAWNGSLHEVRRLLDEGADVNYTSSDYGRSPLLAAACSSPRPDVVSLLLKRGADVNAINSDGWTALHCAARDKKLDTVTLLLGAGADVDARAVYGETPLHWAARYDKEATVRAMLASGATKDLKAWCFELKGKTAFDLATSDAVRELLRT